MKKIFLFFAVAALALTACNKQDPTPVVEPGLTYTGDTQIEIEEGEYFYTVNFKATKDWEAQVYAEPLSSGKAAVTIDTKSGKSGDKKIKVTFEDLEEGQSGRYAVLGVSTQGFETEPAAGEFFSIIFYQGKVFAFVPVSSVDIPVLGGSVTASFITNCDYVSTNYDQLEECAPCVIDNEKNTISFTVAENKTYDKRQAYVKFTVEEIQVPVVDGEGKPTGETKAATFRFYVNQAGIEYYAYSFDMHKTSFNYAETKVLSSLMFNYVNYISNGTDLIGATESGVESKEWWYGKDFTEKVITTDDAGHLVICNHTSYTGSEYTDGNFMLNYVDIEGKEQPLINMPAWECGGPFGAKIKVTGDLTKDAIIVAPVEGISGITMSSTLGYWEVKNGVVGEYTKLSVTGIAGTWACAAWNTYPNNFPTIVAKGTTAADGFVMTGCYEDNKFYTIDATGAATELLVPTISYVEGETEYDLSDNYGCHSMDIKTIGGVKYLAALASPWWGSYGAGYGWGSAIVVLHKFDSIVPGEYLFSGASFHQAIKTYFSEGDEDMSIFGDILLYERSDGKIGINVTDVNTRGIHSLYIDPKDLK